MCGLPAHTREGRLMAVFGAFVDDSGSHAQSPLMILAGLVASHEDWKRFSDEWYQALTSGKPLKPFNGSVYFKSTEAEGLTKCFDGFTREEADEKVDLLTDITLKYSLYGMLSAVRWSDFVGIVQAGVPRPKGRLHHYFQHPYYLCFHDIVSSIFTQQVSLNHNDEIDFAFDKQGKLLTRCMAQYEKLRPNFLPEFAAIAGQVIPGDDKVLLPLQAADLLAWQSRNRSWPHTGRITPSAVKLIESSKVYYHAFNRGELSAYAAAFDLPPGAVWFLDDPVIHRVGDYRGEDEREEG